MTAAPPSQRKIKALSGWSLAWWDCALVLVFSFAPLILAIAGILVFPTQAKTIGLTIPSAFADYFQQGHLLFVALAIAGSVAAKIWLDAHFRPHSHLAFNAPIALCAALAAMVQTGRYFLEEPELWATGVLSVILLVGVLIPYAWLVANAPTHRTQSVEESLTQSSGDLAQAVRSLRSGDKNES